MYGADKDRFYDILRFVHVLSKHKEKRYALFTFDAFVGVFCNSDKKCPLRSKECDKLEKCVSCFESFIDQDNFFLTKKVRADIYSSFSGINTDAIGLKYSLPNSPLNKANKKTHKKANKAIKKIKIAMRELLTGDIYSAFFRTHQGMNLAKANASSKKITTELFCNNDPEWEEEIHRILHEADNR
jgi:hypothetical protein